MVSEQNSIDFRLFFICRLDYVWMNTPFSDHSDLVNVLDIPNTQMDVMDEKMTLTVSIFMVSFGWHLCGVVLFYHSFGVYLFPYIFLFVYFVCSTQ